MPTLLDLSLAAARALESSADPETGEVDGDALSSYLESIEDLAAKVDSYAVVISALSSEASAAKSKADAIAESLVQPITARRKALERAAEKMRARLLMAAKMHGGELHGAAYAVAVRQASQPTMLVSDSPAPALLNTWRDCAHAMIDSMSASELIAMIGQARAKEEAASLAKLHGDALEDYGVRLSRSEYVAIKAAKAAR